MGIYDMGAWETCPDHTGRLQKGSELNTDLQGHGAML